MNKNIKNLSLQKKLLFSINIIVLLGFTIISTISILTLKQSIERSILNRSISEVSQIRNQLYILLEHQADEDRLQEFISSTVTDSSNIAYAVIIDDNATATAHSDIEKINTKYTDEYTLDGAKNGNVKNSKFYADVQKAWTYDIMVPITFNGEHMGALDIGIFCSEIDSIVKTVVTVLIIGGIIVLIAISALLFFMITKLFKPFNTISEYCIAIDSGNLNFDFDESLLSRNDEIGKITNALRSLKDTMSKMITSISNELEKVSTTTVKLNHGASLTEKSTYQIATSVEQIVKGSENQVELTNSAFDIVKNISLGVNSITSSIEEATNATSKTLDNAIDGSKLITTVVTHIDDMNTKVEATANEMNALHIRSKEIEKIIEIITGIAKQTNLLALNAAIEAARSGEHGKGFSVVADEVKVLAEQCGDAANNIAGLINQIQTDIETSIKYTLESSSTAKESKEFIHEAGLSFNGILEDVSKISSQMQEISATTEEINSSTDNMVNAIEKVTAISNESLKETEEVASSTTLQKNQMSEVTQATEELNDLLTFLKSVVNNFKL